jgi:hypothetical protein
MEVVVANLVDIGMCFWGQEISILFGIDLAIDLLRGLLLIAERKYIVI